nr:MucBP domain-containing protein [Enterococcus hulanensis]
MVFFGIPDPAEYILVNYGIFARGFQRTEYGLSALIPIQRATPAADVTVKYLNEDDEEIQTEKKISGNIGDAYDATTADYKFDTIDDYELDVTRLPTNATGTLDATAKTVVYRYKKNPVPPVTSTVTVKYVDEADAEIRASKTITGNVGDAYDATTPEYKLATINDYVLDESKLPTNGTGTIEAAAQTIVYHYKKNPVLPVTNKVTVKYVDEADKEIRASKTISGNVGDGYDATTPEYKLATIDDYVLDESKLPTNGTGTIEAATQTVVYHYKKNSVPSAASKVTVQYVDEAGKELRDSQTITGKIGVDYDVTTAEYKLSKIGDYQLVEDKLPTNAKGKFGEKDVLVTYVYKKGTTLANTSTNTANPGRHSIVTWARSASQKVLPKTGENNILSNLLVFAGLVISVSALMIFVRKRRI